MRISKASYERLREFNAPYGLDESESVYHADGTVEFPLSSQLEARLRKINPDLERAILIALGVKSN